MPSLREDRMGSCANSFIDVALFPLHRRGDLEGGWVSPEQKPTPAPVSSILAAVGALTAVAGVITGVVLSSELDPAFKMGAVVATLTLLLLLVVTASGWGKRIYSRFEKSRFEGQIATRPELVKELVGFVEQGEKLWGNTGFSGSLARLYESVVQDLQTAKLLKGPTMSPQMYYTWIYHFKVRATRAAASPGLLTTTEFIEIVNELGSLVAGGGEYVRIYLQNLVADPSYSPSKATRDVYELHRELHNSLVTSMERYVETTNADLGTNIGRYFDVLGNLK